MKKNRSSKRARKAPKTILRMPDLDHAKAAVLNRGSGREGAIRPNSRNRKETPANTSVKVQHLTALFPPWHLWANRKCMRRIITGKLFTKISIIVNNFSKPMVLQSVELSGNCTKKQMLLRGDKKMITRKHSHQKRACRMLAPPFQTFAADRSVQ